MIKEKFHNLLKLSISPFFFRAVFKFDEKNHLGVTATGKEFVDFKSNFSNDDRGFGYIRIKVCCIYFQKMVLLHSNNISFSITGFFNHKFFFQTGDEMSKRAKFVLVTWVGPNVSVMKKAKMSTDKALMKDVIQVRIILFSISKVSNFYLLIIFLIYLQNMSVELQLENHGEFSHDHFKMQVDKASGARYGTGVRDL